MKSELNTKPRAKIGSLVECFSDINVALIAAMCFADAADGAILGSTFKALESELGLTPSGLAMMSLCSTLGSKFSAPFWGWMCDEGVASRKMLMMAGTIGWGTCIISLGLCSSVYQLFFVRIVNGIFTSSLAPLQQSWVADIAKPEAYGRVFGMMGLAGGLGSALCGGLTTALSTNLINGFAGWRIMCFVVGFASWGLSLAIFSFMVDKCRAASGRALNPLSAITCVLQNLVKNLRIPTFRCIIAQGIIGTVPWVALQFEIMYLQYLSFSNTQVGMYVAVSGFFGMAGTLIGGLIGDALAQWSKNHGRPLVGQLSVGLGIPVFVTLLFVLPETIGTAVLWPYIVCKTCLSLVCTWTPAGVNRPVLSEIVPRTGRASILAWQVAIEGGLASLFTLPLVGFLTEQVFGYQATTMSIADMPAEQRQTNALALRSTLLWLGVIPWLMCFAFYSVMHSYYATDRDRMALENAEADEEEAPLNAQ